MIQVNNFKGLYTNVDDILRPADFCVDSNGVMFKGQLVEYVDDLSKLGFNKVNNILFEDEVIFENKGEELKKKIQVYISNLNELVVSDGKKRLVILSNFAYNKYISIKEIANQLHIYYDKDIYTVYLDDNKKEIDFYSHSNILFDVKLSLVSPKDYKDTEVLKEYYMKFYTNNNKERIQFVRVIQEGDKFKFVEGNATIKLRTYSNQYYNFFVNAISKEKRIGIELIDKKVEQRNIYKYYYRIWYNTFEDREIKNNFYYTEIVVGNNIKYESEFANENEIKTILENIKNFSGAILYTFKNNKAGNHIILQNVQATEEYKYEASQGNNHTWVATHYVAESELSYSDKYVMYKYNQVFNEYFSKYFDSGEVQSNYQNTWRRVDWITLYMPVSYVNELPKIVIPFFKPIKVKVSVSLIDGSEYIIKDQYFHIRYTGKIFKDGTLEYDKGKILQIEILELPSYVKNVSVYFSEYFDITALSKLEELDEKQFSKYYLGKVYDKEGIYTIDSQNIVGTLIDQSIGINEKDYELVRDIDDYVFLNNIVIAYKCNNLYYSAIGNRVLIYNLYKKRTILYNENIRKVIPNGNNRIYVVCDNYTELLELNQVQGEIIFTTLFTYDIGTNNKNYVTSILNSPVLYFNKNIYILSQQINEISEPIKDLLNNVKYVLSDNALKNIYVVTDDYLLVYNLDYKTWNKFNAKIYFVRDYGRIKQTEYIYKNDVYVLYRSGYGLVNFDKVITNIEGVELDRKIYELPIGQVVEYKVVNKIMSHIIYIKTFRRLYDNSRILKEGDREDKNAVTD